MNEIVGNLQPMVVVNPPMRKIVDLSGSKRENAVKVANDLGDWLGEQGFNVEKQGNVIMSNGPPTEIQQRISTYFGHGQDAEFSEDKILQDYPETFDKNYGAISNPPSFKVGDEVKIDADHPHWGRVVGDAKVLDVMPGKLIVDAKTIKAAISIKKSEATHINPAWKLPHADTAVQQVMQGQVAVALSQLPPPIPADEKRNPKEGEKVPEQEVAVCCEAKECKPEPEKNPPQTMPRTSPTAVKPCVVCNKDTPHFMVGENEWHCEACATAVRDNPRSKSWKMERHAKYREQTGADQTRKPAPHSRSQYWVPGHSRAVGTGGSVPVSGHYKAMNPDVECWCGRPMSKVEIDTIDKGGMVKCPVCGGELDKTEMDNPKSKSWKMERRTKYRDATGADTTHRPAAGARSQFWVKGHERALSPGQVTPVEGHYRQANPEDVAPSIGAMALDNPPEKKPEHKHTFKYLGIANPGGKKLFECVECHKKFVRDA